MKHPHAGYDGAALRQLDELPPWWPADTGSVVRPLTPDPLTQFPVLLNTVAGVLSDVELDEPGYHEGPVAWIAWAVDATPHVLTALDALDVAASSVREQLARYQLLAECAGAWQDSLDDEGEEQ